MLPSLAERIVGRLAASKLVNPKTEEIIVDRNEEIDEENAKGIVAAGIDKVHVRSPLNCQAKQGSARSATAETWPEDIWSTSILR